MFFLVYDLNKWIYYNWRKEGNMVDIMQANIAY